MLYITLAVALLLSFVVLSRPWRVWARTGITVSIGLCAMLTFFLVPEVHFLGPDESSWKADLVLLAVLLLGMSAKYFWDLIEERQQRNAKLAAGTPKGGLAFDFWDFVKPLLVSVIVFEAVAGVQHSLSRAALVGSFQNGFFWQTVFQKKATK